MTNINSEATTTAQSNFFIAKIGVQYDGRESVRFGMVPAESIEAARTKIISLIMVNYFGNGNPEDMEDTEDGQYTDGDEIFWVKDLIQISASTYEELNGKHIL